MKVVYRNVTDDLLCIWIYVDEGMTFVASLAVKKTPSGVYFLNVNKGVQSLMREDLEPCRFIVDHLEKPRVEERL